MVADRRRGSRAGEHERAPRAHDRDPTAPQPARTSLHVVPRAGAHADRQPPERATRRAGDRVVLGEEVVAGAQGEVVGDAGSGAVLVVVEPASSTAICTVSVVMPALRATTAGFAWKAMPNQQTNVFGE